MRNKKRYVKVLNDGDDANTTSNSPRGVKIVTQPKPFAAPAIQPFGSMLVKIANGNAHQTNKTIVAKTLGHPQKNLQTPTSLIKTALATTILLY